MFKRPLYLALATLLCSPALISTLQARPGENRSELERRILNDRIAVKVSDRDVDAKVNHRSVPYRWLYKYFPEGVEHVVYFKPAEAERASQNDLDSEFPEGWEVHVVYYKGKSVFEAYRRNGPGISKYEEEGLLALNKGESFWKRVEKNDMKDSAIGYAYEREDGKVRARRDRNFVFLYLADFDTTIFEELQVEKAEEDADAAEAAPDSLRGF